MSVTLRAARTLADFTQIHRMQADMAAWDAAECVALGFPADGVAAAFYSADAAQLRAEFTTSGALMLLAEDGDAILGHAGFTGYDPDTAEVQKVWVDPAARGHGIAGRLLAELRGAMVGAGYAGACLETTVFMRDAIRLYERAGFMRAVPFRRPSPGLGPVTVFMRSQF